MTWKNKLRWRRGCVLLVTNRTAIHVACMQLSTCKWMTLVGWAQALWQHSTVTFRSNWTDWCERKLRETFNGRISQYNTISYTSRREGDKIKVGYLTLWYIARLKLSVKKRRYSVSGNQTHIAEKLKGSSAYNFCVHLFIFSLVGYILYSYLVYIHLTKLNLVPFYDFFKLYACNLS